MTNQYFIRKSWFRFLLTVFAFTILFSVLIPVCHADESADRTTFFSSDFENSSEPEKWEPFGGHVTLKADASVSHSGKYSLKAYDRESGFDGPSVSLSDMIQPDTRYTVSVWCSHNGKNADTLKISLKSTYSGEATYDTIASFSDANPDTWIKLEGEFSVPAGTDESFLYIESSDSESDLWIDDFTLSLSKLEVSYDDYSISPYGTTIFNFDIIPPEVSSYRNSIIRCSDKLVFHGSRSLYVSSRKDCRDGLAVNLKNLNKEKSYRCSASVAFSDKTTESESFSMYLEYHINGILYNIPVEANHPADRGSWSVISGTFSIPENASDPFISICTVRPDDEYNYSHISFYVDDLTVTDDLKTPQEKMNSRKKSQKTTVISSVLLTAAAVCFIFLRRHIKTAGNLRTAATDSMTGVLNRNAYEEKITYFEKHPRKCLNIHLALCDLDNLKDTNDIFGHNAGDESIRRCADILSEVMKKSKGSVYRTGGDEFICMSRNDFRKELETAVESAEKDEFPYPFSVASGFAAYDAATDGKTPDIKKIIARCDKAMYRNKSERKSSENNSENAGQNIQVI